MRKFTILDGNRTKKHLLNINGAQIPANWIHKNHFSCSKSIRISIFLQSLLFKEIAYHSFARGNILERIKWVRCNRTRGTHTHTWMVLQPCKTPNTVYPVSTGVYINFYPINRASNKRNYILHTTVKPNIYYVNDQYFHTPHTNDADAIRRWQTTRNSAEAAEKTMRKW